MKVSIEWHKNAAGDFYGVINSPITVKLVKTREWVSPDHSEGDYMIFDFSADEEMDFRIEPVLIGLLNDDEVFLQFGDDVSASTIGDSYSAVGPYAGFMNKYIDENGNESFSLNPDWQHRAEFEEIMQKHGEDDEAGAREFAAYIRGLHTPAFN